MGKDESVIKNLKMSVGLSALAGLALATPVIANTGDMPIEANVVNTCSVSATALDFGRLDIATITQKDASATVTVSCFGVAVFRVELDDGSNAAVIGQRRMTNGRGEYLTYEVYRNNRRTQRWGLRPSSARNGVIVARGGGSTDLEAYGRVSGITPATATGIYTDMLTVTVTL